MINEADKRPRMKCICGGISFLRSRDSGEVVCRKCGTVLFEDNVDQGPEWRSYNEYERDKRRIGSPLTLLESDLGVSTRPFSMGSDATRYNSRRKKLGRMARIQSRAESSSRKRIYRLLQEIKFVGERLSLSRIELETAARIARKAITLDSKKRWNSLALAVASIYIACRLNENAKKLNEILREIPNWSYNKKDIIKTYRFLTTNLNVRPPLMSEEKSLKRIMKRLGLNKNVLMLSSEIIKKAKRARIGVGKSPGSVAAASVYIAHRLHGQKITQKDVCKAAKTTEVTLRSRVRGILRKLDIDIEV